MSRWSSALERCYAGCLRLADRALTRPGRLAIVVLPVVLLGLVAIAELVLADFPNSGDEYVYLYQAATLAAGRLWNVAPAQPESFQFNYIIFAGDRAFGSFPPGWPLALALATHLRLPLRLVNPVLGTLSLYLVAVLGARLYNARVGVLAAFVVGASAFFLFNAASYFSHTFCGVLLLGAATIAAREDPRPAWVPLTVGLLIGWAVLTRYFTGVVCAIPIVLLLIRRGVPAARTLVLCAAGGLPWVMVLLAYNTALTGDPWQLTTTPLTRSLWFAPGFALRGADILSTHLLRFLLWTPPLLVAAYTVYLVRGPRDLRRGAIDWMPVFVALPLYFYVERGGNQYGPRFYYEVFPFMVLFVTAHLCREATFAEKSRYDRQLFAAMVASVAVLPLSFAAHAHVERRVIRERADPFRMAEQAHLANALVLVGGRVGTERSMAATDLTRNGIDFDRSVLYGLDIGPEENCRVAATYATRRTFLYVWDHEHRRGVLEPIECARIVR
ncbi:MAG: ArnT family glycosyltransferase [Vicinamibacterales bacterium]